MFIAFVVLGVVLQVLYRVAVAILMLHSTPLQAQCTQQFEAMLLLRNELDQNLLMPNVLVPFVLKLRISVWITLQLTFCQPSLLYHLSCFFSSNMLESSFPRRNLYSSFVHLCYRNLPSMNCTNEKRANKRRQNSWSLYLTQHRM
jgi:hypothetical protein